MPAAAPDLYLPIHANEMLGAADQFGFRPERFINPHDYWVQAMGRLRPGVSLAQAQAALAPKFHQWVAATATNDRERARSPSWWSTRAQADSARSAGRTRSRCMC